MITAIFIGFLCWACLSLYLAIGELDQAVRDSEERAEVENDRLEVSLAEEIRQLRAEINELREIVFGEGEG